MSDEPANMEGFALTCSTCPVGRDDRVDRGFDGARIGHLPHTALSMMVGRSQPSVQDLEQILGDLPEIVPSAMSGPAAELRR